MVSLKRNYSLRKILLIFMSVFFFIILILLCVLDFYSIANYQNERTLEMENLLSEYLVYDEFNMGSIKAELYNIYSSDVFFDELSRNYDAMSAYLDIYNLKDKLRSLVVSEEFIHGYDIIYAGKTREFYYADLDALTSDEMKTIRSVLISLLENHRWGRYWYFGTAEGIPCAFCIYSKGIAQIASVTRLDLQEKEMENKLKKYRANVFYVGDNEILGNTIPDISYKDLQPYLDKDTFSLRYEKTLVEGRKIKNTGLWLCMAIQLDFFSYMNIPQLFLLILTLIFFVSALYLYFLMQKELLTPLYRLVEKMHMIGQGNLEPQIDCRSHLQEIGMVDKTLDNMIVELNEQKMISYEQTIEKQKAQLQYLSSQLKPHFYLNGLKTLNALAANNETKRIQAIVMRLSYHMRYILQMEKDLVLLKDEIAYVNNYTELQKEMTDRPLSVVWNVDEELYDRMVPTLCLQTFVENSFKYAKVGNALAELVVRITIVELETEDGKFLSISIMDNGDGYPEEILKEINKKETENSPGVGINNLKRRCRILYGDKIEYDFYNDGGAVSDLFLPERQ